MYPVSETFQRIYNPSATEAEPWYINDHCFIRDRQGLWHMFGITHAEPAQPLEEKFFAHATSPDLLAAQWTKQPHVLHADYEHWQETHVWAPHIIEHADRYFMFYCAGGDDHQRYKIHLATSPDLWHWTRHPANPMVVDGFDARDPMLIHHDNQWIMYYTATTAPEGGYHVVAAVTSPDLIHWGNKRVVFVSAQHGTFAGPTESPFVVARAGRFYLFVCTNDPYNTSAVYVSDTPYAWEAQNLVGTFPTHASEIIHLADEDRWYISRCGWGEGGLYLSPLHWPAEPNAQL